MNVKTISGVIYSTMAGIAAPFILQATADLPAEGRLAAGATVFVLCTLVSLLSSMNVASSSDVTEGSVTIEEEDVDDGREGGIVKWFNVTKGFGFITRDEGDDVFVHFRSIRGTGHRSLVEGQRVKFEVVQSDKGLQAEDVSVIRS